MIPGFFHGFDPGTGGLQLHQLRFDVHDDDAETAERAAELSAGAIGPGLRLPPLLGAKCGVG